MQVNVVEVDLVGEGPGSSTSPRKMSQRALSGLLEGMARV
jgi:hypothetical protein